MKRTKRTSMLYDSWPSKVEHDLSVLHEAIATGDFDRLGQTAESNALAMHATGLGAWPPVLFWLPETVATLHRLWSLREDGLRAYCTMDAGPNVKLLFLAEEEPRVMEAFPALRVVAPFAG
jgi:diphosphomevalonate decarboxylase